MKPFKKDKKHLETAVLIVNGKANFKDRLWIELSIGNILKFTSPYRDFKIFAWNHDRENPAVIRYLDSVKPHVETLDEGNVDLTGWDGVRYDVSPQQTKNYFAGGLHVHRAPLQILYEHVTREYDVDIIFTFDSDSWPIRNNWDVPLFYRLGKDTRLTGIWRDELDAVIPPYVHPSCLGIKAETVEALKLRFDRDPAPPGEDTLSHFTHEVRRRFGAEAIYPLKRSNRREYHPVFNGVYGGAVYHHHLGSRYREGKIARPVTHGWQERGEDLDDNRFLLDATTAMVFEHTGGFIHDLAHGERAFDFKLYDNYLKNAAGDTDEAYDRLFQKAKEIGEKKPAEAYYISGLISKHFAYNTGFLRFHAELCGKMGYVDEAGGYSALASSNDNKESQ